MLQRLQQRTEARQKRSSLQRMTIVYGVLLVCSLLIVARLIELQIVRGEDYRQTAQQIHYSHIMLNPRRGILYAVNSRTNERTIVATNATFDFVYVDPTEVDDPRIVATLLANVLLTNELHALCSSASTDCPRELITFASSPYATLYDPLATLQRNGTGGVMIDGHVVLPSLPPVVVPPIAEVRRLFAQAIEQRIAVKRLTFVPLKYSATNSEIERISALGVPGVSINRRERLIFADPTVVPQKTITQIAQAIGTALLQDPATIEHTLLDRPIRYVPVLRRISVEASLRLKEQLLKSLAETNKQRATATTQEELSSIHDPLRGIAIVPEDWRFYPDDTLASQVIGFLRRDRDQQIAEYGIERSFDTNLRGQAGVIVAGRDERQGLILTSMQRIDNAEDGSDLVLTIDPFVQREVERIMQQALEQFRAESAQAIVMDPLTGRIIAMVNAPLFSRTSYGSVFTKEPLLLSPERERDIIVEVYEPTTQVRIAKAYLWQLTSDEGRASLPERIQRLLAENLREYDLPNISRYYLSLNTNGNARLEIFPTQVPHVWLKFVNTIGVGAYLNKTVQEIYEPGSVMKPITMSIAIDQGELTPTSTYNDTGPIKVDEYPIDNAGGKHYGTLTMTDCLALSVNTCMAHVAEILGKKLFQGALQRFGFGQITGIPLEDELPGRLKPWKDWSNSELANAAFGQGISVTPLQMVTAFAALANGGKLMRPILVDRIIHNDGSEEVTDPEIVDQVIAPETAQTMTAMLVAATRTGFAKKGKVPGYTIAGKTGTSQIAYKGAWETGTGSTIGTYMGYGPAVNPRFVVLVKFDRSRNAYISYGENTAGPTFQKIAAFLFKYYGIRPDDDV